MKKLVILASGSGSNAENIILFFKNNPKIEVHSVLTNKKDAKVLERAKKLNVESHFFSKNDFLDGDLVLKYLQKKRRLCNFSRIFVKSP